MAGASLTTELVAELAAVAEAQGCELLNAEFRSGTLRLILDREGGVRLEDCEAVSKQASALLDVAGFGSGRYTLEVSSPGLDRQLYGPRDYERFTGRRVKVRFVDPATGRRATVAGRLAAFRPDSAGGELELTGTESKRDLVIRVADVQLARLEIEL
jgi:ribosome maturation factor RimP